MPSAKNDETQALWSKKKCALLVQRGYVRQRNLLCAAYSAGKKKNNDKYNKKSSDYSLSLLTMNENSKNVERTNTKRKGKLKYTNGIENDADVVADAVERRVEMEKNAFAEEKKTAKAFHEGKQKCEDTNTGAI